MNQSKIRFSYFTPGPNPRETADKGNATFNELPASAKVLEQARHCKAICDRHGVPLKAAALQFVFGHPTVAAVIPGPRSVSEAEENFQMMAHPISPALWQELRHEGLIPADAPTPLNNGKDSGSEGVENPLLH